MSRSDGPGLNGANPNQHRASSSSHHRPATPPPSVGPPANEGYRSRNDDGHHRTDIGDGDGNGHGREDEHDPTRLTGGLEGDAAPLRSPISFTLTSPVVHSPLPTLTTALDVDVESSPASSASSVDTTLPTPELSNEEDRTTMASTSHHYLSHPHPRPHPHHHAHAHGHPHTHTQSPHPSSPDWRGPDEYSPKSSDAPSVVDIFSPTNNPVSAYEVSPTADDPSSTTVPLPPGISLSSRPRSSSRAPPPPPIILRESSDMPPPPPPPRSSLSSNPNRRSLASPLRPISNGDTTAAPKGLNIPGVFVDGSSAPIRRAGAAAGEELEAEDQLPELLPSPRRSTFQSSISDAAPSSPWQSFDSPRWDRSSSLDVPPPLSASAYGSPVQPSHARRTSSLAPSPMSASQPRFDPTPEHGLHARNLSIYFPRPDAPSQEGSRSPGPESEPPQVVLPAGEERSVFARNGEWSFGQPTDDNAPEGSKRSKRRGHHHKHSLSHNFFSFLDPTVTNPALSSSPNLSPGPIPISSPKPANAPQPVPMPLLSSRHSLALSSPTLSPLPPRRDPQVQLLAAFSVLEFVVGAGLWVEGQMGGWRCLAGVGYLVVFDALGVGVRAISRAGEGWTSARRPYGIARLSSLLYFAQSLFLVFAAVYIAKESIEQVVLGAGAHDHSSGGGGHSHGQMPVEGDERPFPMLLLLIAGITAMVSGSAMSNHAKLVEAVGTLFLPPSYLALPILRRLGNVAVNPFTLSVAGSALAILLGALVVPSSSLHTFDSLAALMLTLLTTALSLSPTKAFGLVLLQTAPPASAAQMRAIRRALKELREDRRVLSVGTVRCWAVEPGSGEYSGSGSGSSSHGARSGGVHSRHASDSRPGSPSLGGRSASRSSSISASPSAGNSPTLGEFGFANANGNGFFGNGGSGGVGGGLSKRSSYGSLLKEKEKGIAPGDRDWDWDRDRDGKERDGAGAGAGAGVGKATGCQLVLSVELRVSEDSGEREVVELTKRAWVMLEKESGKGEVCVGVKRGLE